MEAVAGLVGVVVVVTAYKEVVEAGASGNSGGGGDAAVAAVDDDDGPSFAVVVDGEEEAGLLGPLYLVLIIMADDSTVFCGGLRLSVATFLHRSFVSIGERKEEKVKICTSVVIHPIKAIREEQSMTNHSPSKNCKSQSMNLSGV